MPKTGSIVYEKWSSFKVKERKIGEQAPTTMRHLGNSVKPKHRGLPVDSGVSIFLGPFFAVNQKNGDHKTWTHH